MRFRLGGVRVIGSGMGYLPRLMVPFYTILGGKGRNLGPLCAPVFLILLGIDLIYEKVLDNWIKFW